MTSDIETRTLAKVSLRLIPFMIFLYLLNYLDRVNISCAKLQMNHDLNLNDVDYSWAVAAFYVGYCLFEVPSNLVLARVGARLWISRIMISWGIVSALMLFIRGPWSFFGSRFLLGCAEAGFFPGMILYLTYWVPQRQRARASAWFLTSTALAGVVGNPLAGYLMGLAGSDAAAKGHGLAGWQLLFLIEGVATVFFGFVALFYLTDKPKDAKWLSEEERAWLSDHLEKENTGEGDHHHIGPAFRDRKVWILSFVYSTMLLGFYGVIYWTPTIVKDVTQSNDDVRIGLLSAIPFISAVIGMVLVGRSSDLRGERPLHVMLSCLTSSVGMLIASQSSTPVMAIAGLSLAAAGAFGSLGPFWAMPPAFLRGAAAAAGIAVINSVGNFGGGFIGPLVMGFLKNYNHEYALKHDTKDYAMGLIFYAIALFAGAVVSFALIKTPPPAPAPVKMTKALNDSAVV